MRAKIDATVAAVMLAYIIYAKVSGDDDLRKLRAHGQYHYGRLRRWWARIDEPVWKSELRGYFTVSDNPVPSLEK